MLINRVFQKRLLKKKNSKILGKSFNVSGHAKGTDKLFCFNKQVPEPVMYSFKISSFTISQMSYPVLWRSFYTACYSDCLYFYIKTL